jgi:hypothetical protein
MPALESAHAIAHSEGGAHDEEEPASGRESIRSGIRMFSRSPDAGSRCDIEFDRTCTTSSER